MTRKDLKIALFDAICESIGNDGQFDLDFILNKLEEIGCTLPEDKK